MSPGGEIGMVDPELMLGYGEPNERQLSLGDNFYMTDDPQSYIDPQLQDETTDPGLASSLSYQTYADAANATFPPWQDPDDYDMNAFGAGPKVQHNGEHHTIGYETFPSDHDLFRLYSSTVDQLHPNVEKIKQLWASTTNDPTSAAQTEKSSTDRQYSSMSPMRPGVRIRIDESYREKLADRLMKLQSNDEVLPSIEYLVWCNPTTEISYS